ncbi:MAG: cysteine hydrolase family protein [Acidobacteriaceae bacterium]
MRALIVVDAQNEFSAQGLRPVPSHVEALARIHLCVQQARQQGRPIAWVRHYNRPTESRAFVPGTWGAELSAGLGHQPGFGPEHLFEKDVFGAFTGTGLEAWLHSIHADGVLIVGFYTHMCVSTSAREALVRGFDVAIDAEATGACELNDQALGRQTADEVRRSALLHLVNMGVTIASTEQQIQEVPAASMTSGSLIGSRISALAE